MCAKADDARRDATRVTGCLLAMAYVAWLLAVPGRAKAQAVSLPPAGDVGKPILQDVSSGRHRLRRWPLRSDVTRDLRALDDSAGGASLGSRGGQLTPSANGVVYQLVIIEARRFAPTADDTADLKTAVGIEAGQACDELDHEWRR